MRMLWIIIAIIIVAIDQIVKYFVLQNIETGQMIPVIDKFFYLTLHHNPGGAWGVMRESRLVFLILIPVISAVVVWVLFKSRSLFLKFALSIVLGGAIGNYIDRLLIGKVTDYLLFYIGSYPFPIFNAADMAITCGTILLAVYMLFIYKEPPKGQKIGGKEASQDKVAAMNGLETADAANEPDAAGEKAEGNTAKAVNETDVGDQQ